MNDFSQNPPQPFDDALPERLLQGEKEKQADGTVHVHRGIPGVFSPYIVRLTKEHGPSAGESFIIEDADIFPDEAPLVEYHNGGLHFAEDHALSQIVEDAVSKDALPAIAAYPATRGYDDAIAFSEPSLVVEAKDIFAELLREEYAQEPHVSLDEALATLESQPNSQESIAESIPEVFEESVSLSPVDSYVVAYDTGEERIVSPDPVPVFERTNPPRSGWKVHARASLAFATLAAVVLLPLQASFVFASAKNTQARVEAQSSAGLSQFLRGADALQAQDFSEASTLFGNASGAFANASESLDDVHGVVAAAISLIPTTERTATTADALVTIGQDVSRASTLLAKGMDEVSAAQSLSVTDRLALMIAYTEEALPYIEDASAASSRVDIGVVPEDMQEKVAHIVAILPVLAQSFHEVVSYGDALGAILGGNGKRTYMLAFQNNTELRPTGGFVGSFAEVSFDQGAMTNMRIPEGGTYDVQGQLHAFVASPGPLQLVRARWEFQDANWFPDFPTSARKMLWFYQSAGGPSVDGVLAINASVLEEVLKVLGPISLADGTQLNAENILFEIQKETEITYDKEENAPKAIIGELTNIIFAKMAEADAQTLLRVASIFVDAFNGRDMQVYFSNNELQSSMQDLGWTGTMRKNDDDYLMVVHTNIGGGKTDTVITRDVTVDATIAEDGTIENTVTLTQTHHGMANALFTSINNVDYVRLYVPEGSTFITGSGFEIPSEDLFKKSEYPLNVDEDLALTMQAIEKDPATQTDIWNEGGRTVFGNWIQTAPGETQTIAFTYRLPLRAISSDASSNVLSIAKHVLGARTALSYALVVQKQSGVAQNVLVRVHTPGDAQQVWSSNGEESSELYNEHQRSDIFAGWIFER